MGKNERFLQACRCTPVDRVPVWLMRQAGRYMPAYRAIRERHGFLEMVKTPELATEITLQPVRAFGMDAAIIFADILTLLEAAGMDLEFVDGGGPRLPHPLRTRSDVERLRPVEPRSDLVYTLEALALTRKELDGTVPLIGFSGAPFTLASYAIEGGSTRSFEHCLGLLRDEPECWHRLMDFLAGAVADYLVAQAEAGAQALQLFDSWVGRVSPEAFRTAVLPHTRAVLDRVRDRTEVPVIHFGTGTAPLLDAIAETKPDVMGIDAETDIRAAAEHLGPAVAVQGNLDPQCLLGPRDAMLDAARDLLDSMARRPGYIFNLGHGVLKETEPDTVRELVELVQTYHPAT